jgi:hypothetical protein
VADNPAVKERVAKAPVGIVPFALLAAPGLGLSRDLGEDLATAMINSGFRLADRGQLDKALAELHVQDPYGHCSPASFPVAVRTVAP